MTQTYRAALTALAIAGAAALCGPATAQDDASLRADTDDNAHVIGTGNFVTNGSNTRMKTNGTYHQLCTTLAGGREVCMNIVASRTMDGIKVTTRSAPDGTPLIDFTFDDKNTRSRVYRTYAVARFVARLKLVSEALENMSTNATAPGDDAAKGKCGGNSKLTADTSSDSQDCDSGPGGGGDTGSTDPGGGGGGGGGGGANTPSDIPNAGTQVITAYRNPDPPPSPPVDIHGDPITPPTSGNIAGVPVVVVQGPRINDAPISIPVPRLDLPAVSLSQIWDGCISTPIMITCANAGRREKNDPNWIPPVVHTPPPLPPVSSGWESLRNWWASWWPFPEIDWCNLIGYGCVAKPSESGGSSGSSGSSGYNPPLPPDTTDRRVAQCHDWLEAQAVYCREVVEKLMTPKDLEVCVDNAMADFHQCYQDATGKPFPSLTSNSN